MKKEQDDSCDCGCLNPNLCDCGVKMSRVLKTKTELNSGVDYQKTAWVAMAGVDIDDFPGVCNIAPARGGYASYRKTG